MYIYIYIYIYVVHHGPSPSVLKMPRRAVCNKCGGQCTELREKFEVQHRAEEEAEAEAAKRLVCPHLQAAQEKTEAEEEEQRRKAEAEDRRGGRLVSPLLAEVDDWEEAFQARKRRRCWW